MAASLTGTGVTVTTAGGGISVLSSQSSATAATAAYAMDEGAGTTISDATGGGITGQIQGASWTSGKYGKALSFNGTSSYVDLGGASALKGAGSMSWTAWVYAAGNPPDDGQIIALSDNASGWQLKTTPDTGVRTFGVAVSGASGSHTQRYSKKVLSLNTWYHVAGVYNATAKTLDIYVNGVLDNGLLVGTIPGSQVLPAINPTIGKRAGGFYFNGVIDNLRVYTRALSATEVQGDMTTAISSSTGTGALPTVSSIQCSPTSIASGGSSKCTVSLSAAAPSGGSAVALSDNSSALTVPTSVTVAAGSSSASFTATAGSVTTTQSATITASLNGKSVTTSITISTSSITVVSSMQCSPTSIAPGGSSKCTVSLSAAAPSGGSAVALSDNSSALTVPTSVTVAAGSSSASFTATAGSVTTTQSVTITASLNGKSVNTSLTIQPSSSTSGLAAAYAFDEGSGSTVGDASGNGNVGQIQGATWSTTAKYGKAISFNGTSSYIDLGNPASLQSTGSMTWSAWVYATGNPPDDGQIVARSNDSTGWQFKTSPDTGVRTFAVAVSGSAGSLTQRYSKTVLSLNKWYHVAGVYNAAAKTLDLYVNGVLDDGVLSGTAPGAQVLPSLNTTIGKRSGGYYFNGIIDNLRIYTRALTPTEIQSDMNTAVTIRTATAAVQIAPQQPTTSAMPAARAPSTPTVVPRKRLHSTPGSGALSCSPHIVNAGGTATCEIKGLASSTPVQITVNSNSDQIKVPAVVLSRSNQDSLTFQATVERAATRQSATIAATVGDATISDTIDILSSAGPVLTVPDQQIAKPGAKVNFTVNAADPTGSPVQLAAGSLPSGASFDAASGQFSWTPAESQLGAYVVTFTATNAAGQSSTARVKIDIDSGKPALSPVKLTCSPNAIATLQGKWLGSAGSGLADPSGATTSLGGTQVTVNSEHVPVLSTTLTDVKFLCPVLDAGTSLTVAVETPAGVTNSITAEMRAASPAIFSLDGSGQNQGSISFQDSIDVAMPRNFRVPAHPAQPGDQILIWATGLGQTNSSNGISVTFGDIRVTADDVQPVSGYAGLYVIRATVPTGIVFTDAVPVHLTVTTADGARVDSNTVTAAIEPVR